MIGKYFQPLHWDHQYIYNNEEEIKTKDTTIEVDLCLKNWCDYIKINTKHKPDNENYCKDELIDEDMVQVAVDMAVVKLVKKKEARHLRINKRKRWEKIVPHFPTTNSQNSSFCSNCGEKHLVS